MIRRSLSIRRSPILFLMILKFLAVTSMLTPPSCRSWMARSPVIDSGCWSLSSTSMSAMWMRSGSSSMRPSRSV